MAMASSANQRGRSRKLLYKVKSSTASDGTVVYSIFSCIDDVEHHRHRRNPFDPKYIQAALSSFEELGRDGCERVATREEVEAASTSVHVRMELIKSMKDGLVKLTTEAIKHCKGAAKKTHKKKLFVEENEAHVLEKASTRQEGRNPDAISGEDDYKIYQKKFGQTFEILQVKKKRYGLLAQNQDKSAPVHSIDLGLAQVMKEMELCLDENTNFISEDELCFNLNKETMGTLQNVLQRLVNNPEKLLLPDIDDSYQKPEIDDFENCVQDSIMVGKKMFREALSRSGIDLIERYNMMQEDPSKIPGALHFDLSTGEDESNDFTAAASSDIDVQELEAQNLDMTLTHQYKSSENGNCGIEENLRCKKVLSPAHGTSGTCSPQRIPISSVCQEETLLTDQVCWDNFSWSTGLAQKDREMESMQSKKCRSEKHDRYMSQCIDDIVGNAVSTFRKNNEGSSLSNDMEVCGSGLKTFDFSLMPSVDPYDTSRTADVPRMLSKSPPPDSLQSSEIASQDFRTAEITNQDDTAIDMLRQGTKCRNISTATEDSTLSCLSSETAQYQHKYPSGVEGTMKNSEVQTCKDQKKRFILDELITGAVMAECQLHQKTFSHYDLEPLSQLLSAQIASLYQKQKTKVIVFKDLVDACNYGQNIGLDRSITLQRYFIALLSLAHQQNMGNIKDARIKGFQILLKEGSSGRLSEITLSLFPPGQSVTLS